MAALVPYVVVFALHATLVTLSGVVVAPRGPRRIFGVLLMLADIGVTFFAPDPPVFRFIISLGSTLAFFRVIDLALERVPSLLGTRIALVWLVPDARDAEPAPPAFDVASAVRTGAFAMATLGASWVVYATSTWEPASLRLGARWGAGLVLCYCAVDCAASVSTFFARALGWRLPPLHRDPILSRTVAELWALRWNRVVHGWLARRIFKPLVRHGGGVFVATSGAFVVSAIVHGYLAGNALGIGAGAIMAAFFVVQGVLVLVERALGIAKWRVARVWALTTVIATTPLFVEPMLRVLGL